MGRGCRARLARVRVGHDLVVAFLPDVAALELVVVAVAAALDAQEPERLGELVGPAPVVAAAGLLELVKVDLVVGRVALVEGAAVGRVLLDLLPPDWR